MEDDAPKTNSNDDNNAAVNVGDEPEFTTAEKVFDITSDLNIKPVNDLTAAEEAKEKDAPIANFAEKMAAQTKNARIYRESEAVEKKPEITPKAPIKKDVPIQKSVDLGTDKKIGAEVNAVPKIPNISPEVKAKYHTSTVVQTAPWVKNKPLETVAPIPNKNEPIVDAIPKVQNAPIYTAPKIEPDIPKAPPQNYGLPSSKTIDAPENIVAQTNTVESKPISRDIPLKNVDEMVKSAKEKTVSGFTNRIFPIKGISKLEEQKFDPAQRVIQEDRPINPDENLQKLDSQDNSDEKFKGNIKTIRTYEGDVAEMMSKKKPSTTSIAIAESKRSEGEESIGNNEIQSSHAGKKVVMLLLSLIMIGAGVVGAYYLYMKSPLAPVTPIIQANRISSLVPNDKQVLVSIDKLSPLEIQYKIQNEVTKQQESSTIREIVLTNTKNNVVGRVSGPDTLEALDTDTPDVLRRSLADAWMLGVYADPNGEKDVFVILTNDFFQNAFSGMLQWEAVMADDIKQYLLPVAPLGIANVPDIGIDIPKIINPLENLDNIIPKTIGINTPTTTNTTTPTSTAPKTAIKTATITNKSATSTPNNATSTATSTITNESPSINPYFTIRGRFEDRIVRNKDVRAFRTAENKILFLYSFIDNQRLIITTKESTLNEILLRVEKEAFVR